MEEDYLQETFNPYKATVARLRSILLLHNIDYNNLKKPQLVALVEEHVMPQVPALKEKMAKVKRSSKGIVDASSAEDQAWK